MRAGNSKVLIIGGYGTFGGWVARLLADEAQMTLVIAGRNLHKAEAFVSSWQKRAKMVPLRFDRDHHDNNKQQIGDLAVDFVVDASGPFQAYGTDPYRVAKAAIESGAHYLDIADTSAFVCGIDELDGHAKQNKVFALSGASTCVALSSAVFRYLARDLNNVQSMRGGIAPSPYAGVGPSVMQAVAHSAGRPVDIVLENGSEIAHPFTDARPFTIAPPGDLPLRRRTFSLVDVPDLQLAHTIEATTRDIWFGAAPVPGLYHALLRVLARIVKSGWLPSIAWLSSPMYRVMRHLSWGEHRGGMFIEERGESDNGQVVTKSWQLIAEGDAGPAIPSMASAAIIRKCLNGRWPAAGARPAIDELELEDFEYFFDQMDIRAGVRMKTDPDRWPLFRKILDSAWTEMPTAIRSLHDIDKTQRFRGRASVTRGRSFIARLIGRMVGFPPEASDQSVEVTIESVGGHEHWSRNFDGHTFSSVMSLGTGRFTHLICEQFGPVKFAMALVLTNGRLNYVPRGWTFLGIPMPGFFAPSGKMCEYEADGKFHFHVEIRLPVVGHLVTYKGSLRALP